jgi:bacterioferritin (cytochrome b1)
VSGKANVIEQLNRLLEIEYRSFPMYLADAAPWTSQHDERAVEALKNIVADQRVMSQRIGELILDLGGRIEPGEYPLQFTDTHFLSLDYLLKDLQYYQRQDIADIERIVARLAGDREARELAEEALGAERAHLEAIEALLSQPA